MATGCSNPTTTISRLDPPFKSASCIYTTNTTTVLELLLKNHTLGGTLCLIYCALKHQSCITFSNTAVKSVKGINTEVIGASNRKQVTNPVMGYTVTFHFVKGPPTFIYRLLQGNPGQQRLTIEVAH